MMTAIRAIRLFLPCLALAFLFLQSSAARAEMKEYPAVQLRSLDKVTARTETFEVDVGSTVKFGPLFIKVQACRKAPPIETPESAAFLQIWEITPKDEAKWVFSGWMFASSPALSSMDHPIYDVWVLDCIQTEDADNVKASEAVAGDNESAETNGKKTGPEKQNAAEDSGAETIKMPEN